MNIHVQICAGADLANAAATDLLTSWLENPSIHNVMVAAGNTPIDLYRRIGERHLKISRINVFALDEYVGVPANEPRNCANLLRRCVALPWGISPKQFFTVSSVEGEALQSVKRHEQQIQKGGGLDVIVLGLGQNGHIGFNEPGSRADSEGRVLELDPISVEANRKWFAGDYAPARGVTVGLKTILAARHILLMAYGTHKASAVRAMLEGPIGEACPASFLQSHPDTHLFLDPGAASQLRNRF